MGTGGSNEVQQDGLIVKDRLLLRVGFGLDSTGLPAKAREEMLLKQDRGWSRDCCQSDIRTGDAAQSCRLVRWDTAFRGRYGRSVFAYRAPVRARLLDRIGLLERATDC